jgi:transcriptional regulator with XRE-family HTH domain
MDQIILRDCLLRLMGDMSESNLARAANIPKATINRILSGRTPDPRASTLVPIAQYFGVSLEQLLGVMPLPEQIPLRAQTIAHTHVLQMPFVAMNKIYQWHNQEFPATQHKDIVKDNARFVVDGCYLTQVDTIFMQPKFFNKTHIVVNPQLTTTHGDYVIYHLCESKQTLLRKLIIEGERQFLVCIDPHFNETTPLNNQDIYLGKVVKSEVYLTDTDY